MYLPSLPKPGDEITVAFSGREDGKAEVLEVRPYTGAYPQWFTHIIKYRALNTRRGWMEITADIENERT